MIRFVLTFSISTLLFSCSLSYAAAYELKTIDTPGQNDVLPLHDPAVSQILYGKLEGYPHMYEFYTKEPLELSVAVWTPDVGAPKTDISGIILRVEKRGNVTEVSRLSAKEATWEPFYEWQGGDSYRMGGSYRGKVEQGMYRIEVSAPENHGGYALVVGTENEFPGYFTYIRELVAAKRAMGKSVFGVVRSPFVYAPLIFFAALLFGVAWRIGLPGFLRAFVLKRRRGI